MLLPVTYFEKLMSTSNAPNTNNDVLLLHAYNFLLQGLLLHLIYLFFNCSHHCLSMTFTDAPESMMKDMSISPTFSLIFDILESHKVKTIQGVRVI